MAENAVKVDEKTLHDALQEIPAFAGLPEEQFSWLVSQFEEVRLEAGQVFLREGDPADWLFVMLEGEVQFHRESVPDSPTFTVQAGEVSGVLPYSRLTRVGGTARAVLPVRAARLHRSFFPELLQRLPVLGQRLVSLMSDRIRETAKAEQQRDKLMALGKLSAGLAHELNNPAAAARRATASLRESLESIREASLRLFRNPLSNEQREFIVAFERKAAKYQAPPEADPIVQSDREERITEWLEAHHVTESWKLASVLAESGVETPKLDTLSAELGEMALGDALTRITSLLTIGRLVGEIENSVTRISDLVRAIKDYSYMDQAPVQEVDVHQGIESTLTILSNRLKRGVTVVRNYDPTLPRVCAYGGELNQVWTNLMDNAIDAMQGKGELRIRTARELDRVLVEIGDNGPGMPPEVQSRIFEPFFTTKGVGEGTGLGLDTVCRIVRKHHGEIKVESRLGDTRFQVWIPIDQPRSVQPTAGS
jgi:signal transduction histidine kinase